MDRLTCWLVLEDYEEVVGVALTKRGALKLAKAAAEKEAAVLALTNGHEFDSIDIERSDFPIELGEKPEYAWAVVTGERNGIRFTDALYSLKRAPLRL